MKSIELWPALRRMREAPDQILQMHPEKLLGLPPNVIECKRSADDPRTLPAMFDRIDYCGSGWRGSVSVEVHCSFANPIDMPGVVVQGEDL